MKDFILFFDLIRLKKPIGIMLLFWPCLWGLTLANDFTSSNLQYVIYFIYFFIGSVLMRSAGCIVNDILDRKFDIMVERTKQRPIASGKISVNLSLIYVIILCSFAFLILIQFNFTTILLGLASMPFAFSYPLMKRYTYWPQLFLGLTFNWGMIMGYTALLDQISFEIVLLYLSAIFWTLGYDTIYGVQDIADDEIIGIKSTAIKFKENIKLFVGACYLITFLLIVYVFKTNIGINLSTFFILMFSISLIYQIKIFSENNPMNCLKAFKVNNYSGIFMFTTILFS